jgi:hypothetical protein
LDVCVGVWVYEETPFWTPGKALLVSAFAAGLGYGVSSYTQTPTQTSKSADCVFVELCS